MAEKMLGKSDRTAEFLKSLAVWGETHRPLVAIGLVGSHARGRAAPDSDVDIVLIAEHPERLLSDRNWLDRFGDAERTADEDYGLVRAVRCFYRGGLEVEFGVAGRIWATPPIDPSTADVIADGLCPLYDPERLLERAIAWVGAKGD